MIVKNWKIYLNEKFNIILFLVTTVFFVFITNFYSMFLQMNELREGFKINDPILMLFPSVDLTYLIFIILYSMSVIFVVSIICKPNKVIDFLQVYAFVMIVRMICMSLLPLSAPTDMIILKDPFAELFLDGKILINDLFFSGHTATLFTFFLLSEKRNLRIIFLLSTILVALSLLFQHVHYSIDIIAAPICVYFVFKIQKTLRFYLDSKRKVNH